MPGAIDNSGMINYRGQQPAGFTPSVTYTYSGTNVVVTDASTIPSGDTLTHVHVRVCDRFGGEVRGEITTTGAGGAATVSVASLDRSKGLDMMVTVLTAKMIAADGGAYGLLAAGNVGSWDTQQNA